MAYPWTTMLSSALLRRFLLLSIVLAPTALSAFDCNAGDRAALLAVKEGLGSPPLLATWLPNTNCCAWDHLECDTTTGRVYHVYIIDAGVASGTPVPDAFGDLPFLETLIIHDVPGLSGPIPPSFARLSSLSLLEISNTSVSGQVPTFLDRANLTVLELTNNKLSGAIPPQLAQFPYLAYLDLSGNQLSGSIPPGLVHGEVMYLTLSNNRLSGEIPASYGEGNLDTIELGGNQLSGHPAFLFNRTRPTVKMDLSRNEFEFDLTKAEMPWKLEYLDLSHNRLRGGVPKSLKDLYKLLTLDLTYNMLCGEIPTGRAMAYHHAESYLHNKCLCGTPLPPCPNALSGEPSYGMRPGLDSVN